MKLFELKNLCLQMIGQSPCKSPDQNGATETDEDFLWRLREQYEVSKDKSSLKLSEEDYHRYASLMAENSLIPPMGVVRFKGVEVFFKKKKS